MSKMIIRGDGLLGITILDDGTKIYWADGYGDCHVIVKTDGTRIVVNDPMAPPDKAKAIIEEQRRVEEHPEEQILMTEEENNEWDSVMYG